MKRKAKRNSVWVVEMGGTRRWLPCRTALRQDVAHGFRKQYARGNPDDKYRVTRYVSTR